jgi:ATP-dependent protease HslVU (ClpYQ) peptidase subunit
MNSTRPTRAAVEEMRQEYKHRNTVRHVLSVMTIDQINHIYAIHSANDDLDPDALLFIDAIDDYLDEWYPIQK